MPSACSFYYVGRSENWADGRVVGFTNSMNASLVSEFLLLHSPTAEEFHTEISLIMLDSWHDMSACVAILALKYRDETRRRKIADSLKIMSPISWREIKARWNTVALSSSIQNEALYCLMKRLVTKDGEDTAHALAENTQKRGFNMMIWAIVSFMVNQHCIDILKRLGIRRWNNLRRRIVARLPRRRSHEALMK